MINIFLTLLFVLFLSFSPSTQAAFWDKAESTHVETVVEEDITSDTTTDDGVADDEAVASNEEVEDLIDEPLFR